MLKISFVKIKGEIYYTEMLKNQQGQYYVKSHGAYGVFKGNGAEELGINNREIVYQDEAFFNLVHGQSVDQGKRKKNEAVICGCSQKQLPPYRCVCPGDSPR